MIFTSGQRGHCSGAGFPDLPSEGWTKEQGYPAADRLEGEVAASSWRAHADLDAVLKAAGGSTDSILRQHIWQSDKRFFPVYEAVRKHWQPSPAPSSGLGIGDIGEARIGIDAIAVAADAPGPFTPRSIVAAVDNKALPSASHYSQLVRSGPLLFTAGHIPIRTSEPGKPLVNSFDDVPEQGRVLATGRSHPDSRDGPIAAQTWFVYNELRALLGAAGLSLADAILSTVYLGDLRDFAVFHRVHRQFFPTGGPALCVTCVNEVGHRGCSIEIELTALDPQGGLARKDIPWSIAPPFAAPAGVRAGGFLFLSGMAGYLSSADIAHRADDLDAAARALFDSAAPRPGEEALAAQTAAALARIGETLAASDGRLSDLVKLSIYLCSLADLHAVERVLAAALPGDVLPAVEVVALAAPGPVPSAHVQFDAIAFCP